MPSVMPEVLPNEGAFRRWTWAIEFHHGLLGAFPVQNIQVTKEQNDEVGIL
jgi:hypothetical protein